MMAEMIANYPSQGKSPAVATPARDSAGSSATSNGGNGYLNEVSRATRGDDRTASPSGEHRERLIGRRSIVAAYRFCRTDDIGLLVDALNRCWAPYFPDEPPMTPAAFKRSIRDLQVWCSSCMVAFSGSDPIGVLIGAKRPSGTLVHKIAVHPDHRRQGHGRHLLASLGSKLAILGPRESIAEVPETSRACPRAVQRKRICPGSAPDRLRLAA